MTEAAKPGETTVFATSDDTPLDGQPQQVPPLAEPVPGTVLDDQEADQPPE